MILQFGAAASLLVALGAAEAAQPPRAPVSAPPADARREAARALKALDIGRLAGDAAYARSMLPHLDVVLVASDEGAEGRRWFEAARIVALGTLGRKDEARPMLERLLAAAPLGRDTLMAWAAAAHLEDPPLMVRGIEGMARNLGPEGAGVIDEVLPPEAVFSLSAQLRERGMQAERARLAEALIAMRWQRKEPWMLDSFRVHLIDQRLAACNRDEAARLAREVVGWATLLELLVAKRYDGLVAAPDERLRLAMDEEGRRTAAALAATPDDAGAVHDRILYLRSVGKSQDAASLALPWLADVRKTVEQHERGGWVINDGAYALLALGRTAEALEAMRSLAALDMNALPNRDLIGPSINYGAMLWQAGRPEESLAHIERLRPAAATFANEYGRMWLAAHAVCAHSALGRGAQGEAELRRLQGQPSVNAAALNLALLCRGDLDASERQVIQRLNSDEPSEMLLALQDYHLETPVPEPLQAVRRRLREVRERPAVRAAIERVGRILTLPIDRYYYGST